MAQTVEELTPILEIPTVCIVGDPGAGKTRLAALWPDVYFLDAEGGAGSAVPPERRKRFDIDANILNNVKAEVGKMVNLPYRDKRIFLNDMPIGAVVIDSLDAIQQVHKYDNLLDGKRWNDYRQMWGKLLDDMTLLVFLTKKLKVPTIWVAHVQVKEPVYDQNDNLKKPGWRGIAAQGAFEDQVKRWFDYMLHLYVTDDFKRICITQPTVYQHYKITSAKDRHDTFKLLGRNIFPLEMDQETGFSKTKAMQTIYDRHVY